MKYPRTYHLPWSDGPSDDDERLPDDSIFSGKIIVMTEKMDGENSTLYNDRLHARSIDSVNHPSRTWLKNFWATFNWKIPEGWRICGENMFAKHSIHYLELPSYFLGFSVWTDKNICASWSETWYLFERLGIEPVPVIYKGIYNRKIIEEAWKQPGNENKEGYVIRLAGAFRYDWFSQSVAKWVRKNHVQTSDNWIHSKVIPNKLK